MSAKTRGSYTRQQVIRDLLRALDAPIKDYNQLRATVEAVIERTGLPASDAVWFLRTMQINGWKVAGIPITDIESTIEIYHNARHFPSQRKL